MTEILSDPALQDIAVVFRCHPTMAAAIANRIRERLGRPVSNADIARVMRAIPPTRLSVDVVIARLEQQSQRQRRDKAAPAEKPRRARKKAAPPATRERHTLQEQLQSLLAENWKRAAAHSLSTPDMSVEEFVKAVRSHTGHKDAPLRRIFKAAAALDREDIVLSPPVVADRVNTLATE